MDLYAVKKATDAKNAIVVDDMILTSDMPTTAGSKMLDGYISLLDAEAVIRLKSAGYEICGKARVGEFNIDLLGETNFCGATSDGDILKSATHEIVKSGEAKAAVALDVNGSVLRGTAVTGMVSVKPTYGTVSRFGTIPVACSGETVSVVANNTSDCEEVLKAIAGHDDKDGTSLSEQECASIFEKRELKKKALVFSDMYENADADVKKKIDESLKLLSENGIEIVKKDSGVIKSARIAWNILMSSELCNNVSRYDGVKYGYRSENYTNIDELYTNSRTEAFGELLKTAILYGSENLSTDNYMKIYDKAMRVRRVIAEEFEKLFSEFDVVIMPATSKLEYTKEQVLADKYIAYKENIYTAPAFITGLPAVVANATLFMGEAFSENTLFDYAKMCEKECE